MPALSLSLSSGFFRVNETTFLLEPLEGAVAGQHAVYRAAHLRGKRGTCREPGTTLEYDHEPKIPAAMKLYRWVGIARLLLPELCEVPGRMGAMPLSHECPNTGGFWWEQALGSCAISWSILPPHVMPPEPGGFSQRQAWVFQHASWKKSKTQQNNIPEPS